MSNQLNNKRNLAYRRAAYQSSSYSVNETAQLVTVGLEPADEAKMAYEFLHKNGNQSRYGNVKYLFDYNHDTEFQTYTTSTWVQVRLPRKTRLGSYCIKAGTFCGDTSPFPSDWVLQGSMDGTVFEDIDRREGQVFTAQERKTYTVGQAGAYTHYRLNIEKVQSGDRIHLAGWSLADVNGCELLASYEENVISYVSAWMSLGKREEWIYVDLGEESLFDRVVIHWGSMYATDYEIQVSEDALTWEKVLEDSRGCGGTGELTFETQKARYVRLFLKEANPGSIAYIVREFEVFGTNSLEYRPKKTEKKETGREFLHNSPWKIERAGHLKFPEGNNGGSRERIELGRSIAAKAYDDSDWLPAVVPGTAFLSYLKAGTVADPTYADWQRNASDSYFKSDFWYRTSFNIPKEKYGQRIWLNFDAVNWKARIFLNGVSVGQINGGFIRGKFDITPYAEYDTENYLAVLIIRNTDPGTAYTSNNDGPGTMGGVFGNDGRIGEDAPTYSAANGWDWVPTVRGRNIGIYNDVYLTFTRDVEVVDPWAVTVFDRNEDQTPDLSKINVTLKTELANHSNKAVTVTVKGMIKERPELIFEKELRLEAKENSSVEIGPLVMNAPEIWWPNGYGEQPLYHMQVTAEVDGKQSDGKEFRFGAREFTYTLLESEAVDPNGYKNGDCLTLFCNGVRIVIRGGNWGLEDIHLDVDAEKYDDKIRLHKYENFNIIRNWGGQTNDEQLYQACDKYGIILWDEFFSPGCWLYSPKDPGMFLDNVRDKIKHYRGHACIALYCGANEMHTEVREIEKGIREYVAALDGTRHYFPNSAKAPVAEDGPHKAMLPEFYFKNTLPGIMNSERGMPNIPVAETMKLIFPAESLWPHNDMWALHDFALRWNVDGGGYLKKLEDYGEFDSFEEMLRRAQMQSYELHKAMFEGSIASGSNGLMMWMSNPAWTSLVWQSYDYYHDVNGGYFGLKTACQPVNLIWNQANDRMLLFNGTSDRQTLTAVLEVYDLYGTRIGEKKTAVVVEKASLTDVFSVDFSEYASDLVFLKTRVYDGGGRVIGENFYWHNHRKSRDFKALSELSCTWVTAAISEEVKAEQSGEVWKVYKVAMKNESDRPALLIRLMVQIKEIGERVLPVFYEDNYFSLMPGEAKCVSLEFREKNLFEGTPQIVMEGFNVTRRVC